MSHVIDPVVAIAGIYPVLGLLASEYFSLSDGPIVFELKEPAYPIYRSP